MDQPYRITLIAGALLIVISVGLGSLMPVFQGRVVVDEILVPSSASDSMADFYLLTSCTGRRIC